MPSSTSHSEPRVPWRALMLIAVALATWGVSAFYTLRLNPQIVFFRHAHELKQAWARQLDATRTNKIVFCGDSSCATSVDAQRLLAQDGLPAVNFGMSADIGSKVLLAYAQKYLRPGDTLIVTMDPGLFAVPPRNESVGAQFSFAVGEPSFLRNTNGMDWVTALADLRPGGYHAFTLIGKIALRQPLYRYGLTELHPGGWQEDELHRPIYAWPGAWPELNPAMRQHLAVIRDACQARHIRMAYTLPWVYCPPELVALRRQTGAQFLLEVSEVIPVLKDPTLGIKTNLADFADTPFHPTPAVAAQRTDALAQFISMWQTWSRAELEAIASPRP